MVLHIKSSTRSFLSSALHSHGSAFPSILCFALAVKRNFHSKYVMKSTIVADRDRQNCQNHDCANLGPCMQKETAGGERGVPSNFQSFTNYIFLPSSSSMLVISEKLLADPLPPSMLICFILSSSPCKPFCTRSNATGSLPPAQLSGT